jgi:hypothetical protein
VDIHTAKPINNDVVQTMNTVAYVKGAIFIQTGFHPSIVDANQFAIVPGDPSAPGYRETLSHLPNPYLDTIRTLCGQ